LVPLAIAAILILGLAGVAYGFRDRIPMLQQYLGASAPAAVTPAAPAPQTPASTPAVLNAPATTPAQITTTLASVPPATTQSAPTDPRYAENAPANSATAIPPTPAPPSNAPASAPPVGEVAVATTPAPATPAASAPVQVATAAPPPKPSAPPKPHVPTIAVLAGGDDAISNPALEAIEQALQRSGYRIVDEGSLPRVGRFMDGERPRFAEAVQALRGHADAVVFVNARKVGAQEMSYYGQSSTLYTAQLGVRAYSIEQGRPLGPPWSEQVNFTSLNAAEKSREAVEPMLDRVSERLIDYKPGRRRE
ncbi:MAG: hypothetical protein JSS33_08265, partial [Proteobacteria bacterium]|nr:hypothetical protein [Pseudomonadota bacterium]